MKFIHYIVLLSSVISIAIADVLIKHASINAFVFKDILKSPYFIAALVLYVIQILAFCYLFLHGNKLSLVGLTQIILYAIIVIIASVLFFNESITLIQSIGIICAITGMILINI